MKKIIRNIHRIGTLFFAVTAIVACSTDDHMTQQQLNDDIARDVEITLTTETYQTAEAKLLPKSAVVTRTAWQPQQTETYDLGDGLQATVELSEDETDKTGSQTRAALSQGKYTIYAVDASGNRVGGANNKLVGEMNGSNVYVKDENYHLRVAENTEYTFVCISEGITLNGTQLTFTNGTKNPMIGTIKKKLTPTDRTLSFQMKHQAARIRYKFVVYTESTDGNVAMNLVSTTAQPTTTIYDLKGENSTATPSVTINIPGFTFPSTLTEADAHYVKAHHFYTSYYYLQPGTEGNKLQFQFTGGEIYTGIPMTGKTANVYLPRNPATPTAEPTLDRNKSYTITMKIRPLLYLFNDGTNGILAEKNGRTPIGIVLREKTDTTDGKAVALKASSTPLKWEDGGAGIQRNSIVHKGWSMSPDNKGTGDELNGYDLTWTGIGTEDHVKRAEAQTQYPAFYYAAHYNPGVPTSNIKQWYLPALGEIHTNYYNKKWRTEMPFIFPGNTTTTSIPWDIDGMSIKGISINYLNEYPVKLFKAFSDAQGFLPDNIYFWTASTGASEVGYRPIRMKFSRHNLGGSMTPGVGVFAHANAADKDDVTTLVLPFVHF